MKTVSFDPELREEPDGIKFKPFGCDDDDSDDSSFDSDSTEFEDEEDEMDHTLTYDLSDDDVVVIQQGDPSKSVMEELVFAKKNKVDDRGAFTVSLNVGGKLFRVPSVLIMAHPESKLAELITEHMALREGVSKDVDSAPIFVDSNGDRFQFVMDYLSGGKVYLPSSISKQTLLDDFEQLNIIIDDSDAIVRAGNAKAAKVFLAAKKSAFDAKIAEIDQMKSCIILAYACFQVHLRDQTERIRLVDGKDIESLRQHWRNVRALPKQFVQQLAEHDLECKSLPKFKLGRAYSLHLHLRQIENKVDE